jgi:hypothetical protein
MDGGYGISATRLGMDGIMDKMSLIEATADKYSQNREIQELVLKTLKNVGSAADEQLYAWEKFLEGLPYRREPGEILRNPIQTAKYGGDCDDLTILAIAGAKALGLPAQAEVVADSHQNGFHVRAVVGLPPLNPKEGIIIDPVHRSEPQWAMEGRNLDSAFQKFHSVPLKGKGRKALQGWGQVGEQEESSLSRLLLLAAVMGGLLVVLRMWR